MYSLSQALFSHWASFNVFSIEPLNLTYYLLILFLVYRLTKTIFERRAAVLALTVVALWPSFLMHTTQLLRDPLLIVAQGSGNQFVSQRLAGISLATSFESTRAND